ncbi:MAG: SGNH/GDSL hydrolase family protein [bacterium]
MSKSSEPKEKSAGSKLTRRARLVLIAMPIVILGSGLIGMELYARHIGKFQLWRYPLQKVAFADADRFKIYNQRFYKQRYKSFSQWPIKVPTFDADKPAPKYLFKPNQRVALRAGVLVPANPGETVLWSTNSWGFRGPEFQIPKKESTIRIVCLGASTTEGLGLHDDQTYPYFLQKELNEKFPGQAIEVINAGHHAFEIDDLVELLRQRVLPLQPDIVLFYEATNNINFNEFIKDVPKACPGDCWIDSGWKRFLYSRSAYFDLMADRFNWINRQPAPMPHTLDIALPKRSVTHYREGLRQIVQEALSHKTKIVLTSFITLAHEGAMYSYEEYPVLAPWFYKVHYPYTPGEVARIYDVFNRQSAEVAREFGVPYADLAADFPRTPQYFPIDLMHFSPEGDRLLAHKFAEFLAQEISPQITKTGAGRQP